MVIDIHTHAFPDHLAQRAMAQLQAETDEVKAVLNGTVADLLHSMDRAGIDASVVASIATRPEQFEPILRWSAAICSDRILPFPSVHPSAPNAAEQVRRIAAEGFRGFKLHPYYQNFTVDEERLTPIYTAAAECGLVLLLHGGFDIAFPLDRLADPVRILQVTERFPRLKLVAAHFGAWKDWDEVERHLVGRSIYMDISCSFDFMERAQAEAILKRHPSDRLLFGSDSPWVDQQKTIAGLQSFALGKEFEAKVLGANAQTLLGA
ncbi:MAG: amidohydrolase family protein [Verrucomicrobia bacterium]|nr:amidohydrolase family protein [Verrucomicrobiota bacterium]